MDYCKLAFFSLFAAAGYYLLFNDNFGINIMGGFMLAVSFFATSEAI